MPSVFLVLTISTSNYAFSKRRIGLEMIESFHDKFMFCPQRSPTTPTKRTKFLLSSLFFYQRKNRISKNVSNELSVNRCMMAFLAVFLDAGHLYINDLSSHLFCRNCSACSHFDLSVFVSFSGVVFFYYVLYFLTYVESRDLARHQ